MKKDIHPAAYRPVVFKDMSNGDCFAFEFNSLLSVAS